MFKKWLSAQWGSVLTADGKTGWLSLKQMGVCLRRCCSHLKALPLSHLSSFSHGMGSLSTTQQVAMRNHLTHGHLRQGPLMTHSLELWASSQHPRPEFKSVVCPKPGSILNCPCVSCLLSMWSWPLFSNLLLHHPSFQMAFTLPELCPHVPWTTRPDSTGACMLGFPPTLFLNHIPREVPAGPERCHWMAILNSSPGPPVTISQSSRECGRRVGMASDRASQAG